MLERDDWNQSSFSAHYLAAALDYYIIRVQLPNADGATSRTVFSIDIGAIAYYILLAMLAFKLLSWLLRIPSSRRLRHRRKHNLCPHCAYPIPTPSTPASPS